MQLEGMTGKISVKHKGVNRYLMGAWSGQYRFRKVISRNASQEMPSESAHDHRGSKKPRPARNGPVNATG
jgi:hypothetical protein